MCLTWVQFQQEGAFAIQWLSCYVYRDCQKNVPIEDRFSATTPYAAILISEHYYGKRYNWFRFNCRVARSLFRRDGQLTR